MKASTLLVIVAALVWAFVLRRLLGINWPGAYFSIISLATLIFSGLFGLALAAKMAGIVSTSFLTAIPGWSWLILTGAIEIPVLWWLRRMYSR